MAVEGIVFPVTIRPQYLLSAVSGRADFYPARGLPSGRGAVPHTDVSAPMWTRDQVKR